LKSIFRNSKTLKVDFRDLIMGLFIFKDMSFDQRLRIFLEIADMKSTGLITISRIYSVLKILFMTQEERRRLKKESMSCF